jgi:hypothetical protein
MAQMGCVGSEFDGVPLLSDWADGGRRVLIGRLVLCPADRVSNLTERKHR